MGMSIGTAGLVELSERYDSLDSLRERSKELYDKILAQSSFMLGSSDPNMIAGFNQLVKDYIHTQLSINQVMAGVGDLITRYRAGWGE